MTRRPRLPGYGIVAAGVCLAVLLGAAAPAPAAEEKPSGDPRPWAERPERGLGLYADYAGVVVPRGETVHLDLTVENKGRRDETVALKFTQVPKGWKASLKGGGFGVTGVTVPDGKTRTLTFTAEPDKGLPAGSYVFALEGVTSDGALKAAHQITVTTRERGREAAEMQVTSSYPVLRGATDASFEFTLDVQNKGDVDRTFDLAAQVPEKWEVTFKPGYESKQISSLRIKAGSNQSVAVQVTPEKEAKAGEYPILVRVSSGDAKAEVPLKVVLTGTYKLDAATPSGVMSTEAVQGKPTTVSLIVRNTGTAVNRNISFNSFKPDNWKVEFKPEKLEALEPGAAKQVEATITPAEQALVGDYSVNLSVDGEKASKGLDLRVTVKAQPVWGWVGVGLIALVIGGMGGLFIWLGRR
ncbi:MAG: NEW3 domain-containing protein [Candidatus Methylomirabilales bacterium]